MTKPTSSDSSGIQINSITYFALSALSGAVSCGITHWAITPLDLIKCNMQTNPKFKSTFQGGKMIWNEMGGLKGLYKGGGPTAAGYSVQGAGKFGLFEVFKYNYSRTMDEETAYKYRDLLNFASSCSAEFVTDIFLCPFEAIKVRVQTQPNFARGLSDGLPKMIQQEGLSNVYAGLGPLWARQVPYTIIKFMCFERIAEGIYTKLPKKKSEMNLAQQMGVVLTAGYAAGVLCAAASHPADVLVSKINTLKSEGSLTQKISTIVKGTQEKPGIGFKGLWTGLGTRIFMIGSLTAAQFFIYGGMKSLFGLPTPGGE